VLRLRYQQRSTGCTTQSDTGSPTAAVSPVISRDRPTVPLSTMSYSCGVTVMAVSSPPFSVRASLSAWTLRRWALASAVASGTAVLVGLPTAIISSGYFTRMTAVLWWNYPVWILGSVLAGLAFAACDQSSSGTVAGGGGGGVTLGGVLTALAVGCPSCNSLVVAALGRPGALTIWASLQPVVAIIALALLTRSMLRRLRAEPACPTPPSAATLPL
jgi:hypothetical protein